MRHVATIVIFKSVTENSDNDKYYRRAESLMTPNINLRPDVYRKVGQYGNRDESWNTVLERLVRHVDEEAALRDKDNRQTTDESSSNPSEKEAGPLSKLDDGTRLRHRYQRGDYSGERAEAEVRNGKVSYNGESLSPSRAAVKADKGVRGRDGNSTQNGWTWWEYQLEGDEWRQIDDLR